MANLTITVDPETLKRARIKAIEQGTSVNKVLSAYLAAYASEPASSRSREEAVASDAPVTLGSATERPPFVFDPGDEATLRKRVEAFERHVAMAKEAGARSGGITWTREDLYDRSDHDWSDS